MVLLQKVIAIICLKFVYGQNSIDCPRFCKCDSYLQLNRAQCSARRLINAEVDIPNQVQILDLSFNDITVVNKNCFEKFSYLEYLNLSNNALHTLEWEAFSKLRRLTEINLSYNRLETLDERLFARNKYLKKINLEGNKFMSLKPKALLRNIFVVKLNLKSSQINMLHPELFSGLPNLLELDLSKNLINNFNIEDFRYLQKLQKLNLNKNSFKCDDSIKSKIKQLQKQGINVNMDNCLSEIKANFKQNTEMFERIMMTTKDDQSFVNNKDQWHLNFDLEDDSIEEEEKESTDNRDIESSNYLEIIRTPNEWLKLAPDTILCNARSSIMCQEYRLCLQTLNEAWQNERKHKELCEIYDTKFAFFLGIAVGISSAIFIMVFALCMKNCLEVKKSVPHFTDSRETTENLSTQPLARPASQLPPQVRRQTRRRAAPSPRSVVRYEGPVAENFLSRLFGRPARHQYYRSINHNTATLIRRLSRSNLFNNRLSQHFLDRQGSREANGTGIQDSEPSATRPETPPPLYRDIVIGNREDGK